MDTRIPSVTRSDVVMTESTPRPTPTPVRVPFSQVLAAAASNIAAGAQTALAKLPGSPIEAPAVRGSVVQMQPVGYVGGAQVTTAPQGPAPLAGGGMPISAGVGIGSGLGVGGVGATGGTDPTGGIGQAMQQMADENLYYLQLQEQMDSQNRVFTALSNVLKTEHDTEKSAINNIHS